MDLDDYKNQMSAIKDRCSRELNYLHRDFALSNSPVIIGDIVEDHMGALAVTAIKYTLTSKIPECVYSGIRLTKAGTPRKRDAEVVAHQSNIKSINGTPYSLNSTEAGN